MSNTNRPIFPQKAIITAGMPYGNKSLHLGHIGGVFIPADVYARFLRDRIGKENVLFLSGTDCYGITIETSYKASKEKGFEGSIYDYVRYNHNNQKNTLLKYGISLNSFYASALDRAGEIHANMSKTIFDILLKKGKLKIEKTNQFFDAKEGIFLNGRQVIGRCPIKGCKSEYAYADECSLGHQYPPSDLIAPKSIVSGDTPELVEVYNWYYDLTSQIGYIKNDLIKNKNNTQYRESLRQIVSEYLDNPTLYVKKNDLDLIRCLSGFPPYKVTEEDGKISAIMEFSSLNDREKAKVALDENGIRYTSGKTIVPFRISGNVSWGIPIPKVSSNNKLDNDNLTFWVWPESLWAPISFTKAYLEGKAPEETWEKWWKDTNTKVYQFIGEDNVYFYGIAEKGIFSSIDEKITVPIIIPNHHVLYGKTKASSSGVIKPPTADELLDKYTVDQLRLHFINMDLGKKSVSFSPAAFTGEDGFDKTVYEGNLVTNIFNRIVRSCLYTNQKYNNGFMPKKKVSQEIKEKCDNAILKYEELMYQFAFNNVFELLDISLREANKEWTVRSKTQNEDEMQQLLADYVHIIRVFASLLHPITPNGCEMIRDYFMIDERLWEWKYIFWTVDQFVQNGHRFLPLLPRVDFFRKHSSQLDD